MKAYLIDPFEMSLAVVDIPTTGWSDALHAAYKLMDCQCVDVVRLDNGDFLCVDDEGLLKDPDHQAYFVLVNAEGSLVKFLAGKSVLMREDRSGNIAEPDISIFKLYQHVAFPTDKDVCRKMRDDLLDMSGQWFTLDEKFNPPVDNDNQ